MKGFRGIKKKIIIGVTGSFSSGKTTVASLLKGRDVLVIDADRIAHRLTRRGEVCYKRIVSCFGKGILKKDGSIDREKLAVEAFKSKSMLAKLNRRVHPEVIRSIKREIRSTKKPRIILDAPLLIEAGLQEAVDRLVVVNIGQAAQLKRAKKRTGLNRYQILKRANRQIPLSCKVRMADFVIDNNGSIKNTKMQVDKIRRKLWKN